MGSQNVILIQEDILFPLDLTVILSSLEGVACEKGRNQEPKGKKQTSPKETNQTTITKTNDKRFPVFVLEMVNRCSSDPLRNGLKLK